MQKEKLVKMSVLTKLAGVPGPTIKHYIREGLLPGPAQRTSRNMAYYDPAIADRIKVIKELQQTRFLPLKVIGQILEPAPSTQIRTHLDEVARRQLGELVPAVTAGYDASGMRPKAGRKQDRMTRSQVLRKMDIGEQGLTYLVKQGLVDPPPESGEEQVFEGADLALLRVIDDTRRAGLGHLFPIPILRPYIGAIRTLVRTELELFRSRVLNGPVPENLPVNEIAEHASRLSEQLVLAMRRRLMVTEMSTLAESMDADAQTNGNNGS